MRLLRVRASGYRLIDLQLTLFNGLCSRHATYTVDGQSQRPAPVTDVQLVPPTFFDAVVEVAPQPERCLPSIHCRLFS